MGGRGGGCGFVALKSKGKSSKTGVTKARKAKKNEEIVWRRRGLIPGHSACKADALPLSYTPIWFREEKGRRKREEEGAPPPPLFLFLFFPFSHPRPLFLMIFTPVSP